MNNLEMAEYFDTIADLLEIKGESVYRVLAYRRAGDALRSLGRNIVDVWKDAQLEDIPGVGKAISSKIDELLKTGKLDFYERLVAEIPPGLVEVLRVGDVGPKKAARFWRELGITSVDELEAAANDGRLRTLKGMGARSEARILESIQAMKRRKTDRILLGQAWSTAHDLLTTLRNLPNVVAAEAAGSLRRWRETIGDLDIIVAASDAAAVVRAFVELERVHRVRSQGETKVSVELSDGLMVQVWVHPPDRFGTALQYATGSQLHNVRLRELALNRGLSLSEHGFKKEDGTEILCADEAEVYEVLDLPWIAPELREDRGEIQAALEGQLPLLINVEDLRGDLQSHSDWSDGSATIQTMAEAAKRFGLEYLAITDHSQSLGIAQGLSPERLAQQGVEIEHVNEKLGKGFRLLRGAEVEIRADGSLDYSDELLAELDIVVASLHTSLRQPRERITERLVGAIRNPHVDIIGHPTGRLIAKRDAADLDIERIIDVAAEHGVALEINANPERLDLKDVHVRLAVQRGCLLVINTDAHHADHFDMLKYGVGVARRAWVEAERVINTWPLDRLLEWLQARG